ncbi:YiiX/YebB-like N1pC/P60 family cysteine hydrolase [Endozoicomonadaceae bacterium StTr2]
MKNSPFTIQPGDLVFQQRAEGDAGRAISQVCKGIYGWHVNHVALCLNDDGTLLEAEYPCVATTSLEEFCNQSEPPSSGMPSTFVGRLKQSLHHLIPKALAFAKAQSGLPYNISFSQEFEGWYCSELVLEAFRFANDGEYVFQPSPMSFHDAETGRMLKWWQDYFDELGKPVPEGAPGSHPALLSRSEFLDIVYRFEATADKPEARPAASVPLS